MKTRTMILLMSIITTFSNPGIAAETTVLKYHSKQVSHEISIADGKITGGKSRGAFVWQVDGGAYDGKYLHVTFSSPQRIGCKSWFTQVYEVNEKGPRMLVNVDKCGFAVSNVNEQYYWDSRPGS